jgi:hypothetical protein
MMVKLGIQSDELKLKSYILKMYCIYCNTVHLRIFGIDFRYVETLQCNVSCIGFGA